MPTLAELEREALACTRCPLAAGRTQVVFGVGDPNVMSLGTMLNTAQQYLRYAWWTAVFPGVALCLLTLGIALISDGLNDALNPRLKEMGA